MSDKPSPGRRRLGVLVSGRGSNLQALIDASARGDLDATIALVISNVEGAGALERAAQAAIPTSVMPHRAWSDRESFDSALAAALNEAHVDLVCLAGFMRRLSARFLAEFTGPVLNVHPSLLPAFPGLDAPGQAITHGVKMAGCTVHFVTPELDAGPIVAQASVPVVPGDTATSLASRILVEEHRLLPAAVQRVLDGGWRIVGRRFEDVVVGPNA
jgi:phosphoribosylglycinamide formyltransferase 1